MNRRPAKSFICRSKLFLKYFSNFRIVRGFLAAQFWFSDFSRLSSSWSLPAGHSNKLSYFSIICIGELCGNLQYHRKVVLLHFYFFFLLFHFILNLSFAFLMSLFFSDLNILTIFIYWKNLLKKYKIIKFIINIILKIQNVIKKILLNLFFVINKIQHFSKKIVIYSI